MRALFKNVSRSISHIKSEDLTEVLRGDQREINYTLDAAINTFGAFADFKRPIEPIKQSN